MWRILLIAATWLYSALACSEGQSWVLDNRIVGGRDAQNGEFPWMVTTIKDSTDIHSTKSAASSSMLETLASLQRLTWNGFYHLCGASLVAPDWLVTAAHCIQLDTANAYRIVVGNNNLSSITPDQQRKVRMIVIKQGFDKDTFHNDIALVQLAQPLSNHTALCLADRRPQSNQAGRIVGWGATREGGQAYPILQTADVAILAREECCSWYYGRAITSSMVCAGYDVGGTDACQGDSGGPLLQWHDKKAHLVGIVSWGVGCADPHRPGVYTDVFQFVPWIQYYIGGQYLD